MISPWQSTCLILLGAILAVWFDEGSNNRMQLSIQNNHNCESILKPSSSSTASSTTPLPPPLYPVTDRFSNEQEYDITANGATGNDGGTAVDYMTVLEAVTVRQQQLLTIQTQAKQKWNQALSTAKTSQHDSVINYLRDPVRFIERFQTCVNHKDCYIMYQHVSKTGGTLRSVPGGGTTGAERFFTSILLTHFDDV
jgi:hypothetical protein